ncbi:MAG: hypothetical protein ACREEM_24395 [Blastocatellia bacterium]
MKLQLAEVLNKSAKHEGAIEQMNKSIAAGNRLSNWQFIGFVVVMAGTLLGSMYWAAGMLEKRLDQFERNVNSRFEQIDKRFDTMERHNKERTDDLKARFEDLKQVVLSKR